MTFSLTLLASMLFLLGQPAFIPTIIGALAVIAFLVILRKTLKYNLVASIFSVLGTVLCQFTLLYFDTEYHMVDVLWVMVITLYTFFMLGKIWGIVVLSVNIAGILFFLFFRLNENLSVLDGLKDGQIVALALNFIICALMINFLIFQFLDVIKKAENDLRAVNEELLERNTTVESQHEEKTVMLREIHHRVKNNLQVITSLLRLQSDEFEDEASKQKFEETINRVRSMAHIHERMYQSENLSRIELEDYIESLSEDLIHSYNIQKPISLVVNSEIIEVHPKALVSLALIFNELISNSLKHAFENTQSPIITIDIRNEGEEFVELYYSDNGEWKEQRSKSFGMELIESLTEQLNGTKEIETSKGTHYVFRFDRDSLVDDN
ncbi:MAG: hypothetical protein NXI10_06765 [bacterium]|nr:hypothetical protein [bacterium]